MHFPTWLKACSFSAVCLISAGQLSGCEGNDQQAQTTATSITQTTEPRETTGATDPNAILLDGSDGANWPAFGRTYGERHYSPLAEIDDDNIQRLGLAWHMDLGQGSPVSGPVAVDGILYFATGYSIVRAVDPTTGELLWEYDPKVTEVAGRRLRMGWGIRGIAYWNGKIYTGTHDGRLIALDAGTGEPVWSVMTLPEDSDKLFISGPPRVFDGKVIIGNGGADQSATRGYVTTYDAETGDRLWRFYIVPGNPADGFEDDAMAMAAKTWHGEWWQYGGGGNAWNAMTYDAGQDLIIVGTGNGAPWNRRIRSEGKGDNLFLASIVALDANTGEYRWHYQVNPGETWDYNASMDMELAELEIDGERRKVLMTAPKNGFFYVIDRTNGELISAEPFVKVNWASHIDLETGRPVENPAARYPDGSTFVMWPGPVGAHSWLPMAYHPGTKLVYIPAIEMAASYTDAGITREKWQRLPGYAVDGALEPNLVVEDGGPLNGTSALIAWDPVAQEEVWRVPNPGPWNGGAMATGGNLVFQGQIDRTFNAYAADTDDKLWSFPAEAAVLAPPITYEADGRQYISVLTGVGASISLFGPFLPEAIDYRTEAKRVLTFALDGDATLPASPPVTKRAFADPDFAPAQESYSRGHTTYAYRCATCHGLDALAAGQAPDLRTSPVVLNADGFAAIVREGALENRGMPRFEELTDDELNDVRQYIRTEAAKLREESGD